jgi:ATP/maltotriose-dependent transcriptional regulator MalT
MVELGGQSFLMGTEDPDGFPADREGPVREVFVEPFRIDPMGVSNASCQTTSRIRVLERLSDRELAVLRFLPTMMSNAEITAEMFVSVNTVKTHLKHVYSKLDVTDRRDAVRRARELRLLSSGLREH